MKANLIPLRVLAEAVQDAKKRSISRGECWTDDVVSVQLTVEQVLNLIAIGKDHPRLVAKEQTLDSAKL